METGLCLVTRHISEETLRAPRLPAGAHLNFDCPMETDLSRSNGSVLREWQQNRWRQHQQNQAPQDAPVQPLGLFVRDPDGSPSEVGHEEIDEHSYEQERFNTMGQVGTPAQQPAPCAAGVAKRSINDESDAGDNPCLKPAAPVVRAAAESEVDGNLLGQRAPRPKQQQRWGNSQTCGNDLYRQAQDGDPTMQIQVKILHLCGGADLQVRVGLQAPPVTGI